MERIQSRITDLGRQPSKLRAGDARRRNSVDPAVDAVMLPGQRLRGVPGSNAPRRERSSSDDLFIHSDSLRDQLLAIRRRLWIVNATLESLPAKIEQTYRQRSVIAVGDESAQRRKNSDTILDEAVGLETDKAAVGWWARCKLARLRSRASRAEARAAAALYDASVSFGEALEAVLQAAVARVKADEARFQSLERSFSADVRTGNDRGPRPPEPSAYHVP